MSKNYFRWYIPLCLLILIITQITLAVPPDSSRQKRQVLLTQLLQILPNDPENGHEVTPLDSTWRAWLKRTGELPPDFDTMPSLPFLPDPFILDKEDQNIGITSKLQWLEKREWIKKEITHWITGAFPPPLDNLKANIVKEHKDGQVTLRTVQLNFGPNHEAKLTLELMIPPGDGPFPVFMTQWNHRGWAMIAVRRGYIGCVYAGADAKDDTDTYAEIWYPQYDFTQLMRRAWGSFRAIDYLYTLDIVDKDKIALTGHSRNGKQSLMAAAFDERIKAVIPSSGGTGAEVPFRFTNDKYDDQSILEITDAFPQWLHPRLRFFIGREHKLPVDQNLMMALVAPRGLMLSSALSEGAGNPWAIEQAYFSAKRVYRFLEAENNIAIRLRHGRHGTAARDIEAYIDFFDFVFKRSDRPPDNDLFYNYSFEKWKTLSKENINPLTYDIQASNDLLNIRNNSKIETVSEWASRKEQIQHHIEWTLAEEPAGITNAGPKVLANQRKFDDYLRDVILRPEKSDKMGHIVVGPYHAFGDYLYGNLYYPVDRDHQPPSEKVPVVIFLHEYDHTTGFGRRILPFFEQLVENGFAVFSYDMIGFGTRIQEGTDFYHRYPRWSKMGKMVTDLRGAVDAMENMEFINPEKIFTVGYSLGGTVGLFAAAQDDRISALATVCGFTPLRTSTPDDGTEGILAYSHLHGLIPRFGFFLNRTNRLPLDFPEIIACVAPRPHLIIAPQLDRDAVFNDIEKAVTAVNNVYKIFNVNQNLTFLTPLDYNHFTTEMQNDIIVWLIKNNNKKEDQ